MTFPSLLGCSAPLPFHPGGCLPPAPDMHLPGQEWLGDTGAGARGATASSGARELPSHLPCKCTLEHVYSGDGRTAGTVSGGHEVKVPSVQKGTARCSHLSGALALVCPNRPERRREERAGPEGPLLGHAACPGTHRRTLVPVREGGRLSPTRSQGPGAHEG